MKPLLHMMSFHFWFGSSSLYDEISLFLRRDSISGLVVAACKMKLVYLYEVILFQVR